MGLGAAPRRTWPAGGEGEGEISSGESWLRGSSLTTCCCAFTVLCTRNGLETRTAVTQSRVGQGSTLLHLTRGLQTPQRCQLRVCIIPETDQPNNVSTAVFLGVASLSMWRLG